MSNRNFDYHGEAKFFSEAVTDVAPHDWLHDDMALWMDDYPDVLDGKVILDVGAGEGGYGVLVCEKHDPKRFVALELVPQRLLGAAKKAAELESFSVVSGSAYQLPHPDDTFDIVIGNGALHHMPETESVLSEVARVLKPGGLYFGREPNFHNLAVWWRVLHGPHVSPNEFAVWPRDIIRAFESHGFDVEVSFFSRRAPWLTFKYLAVSQKIRAVLRDNSKR